MSKRKSSHRPGVPQGSAAQRRLAFIIDRTMLYFDVILESRSRLMRAGRLKREHDTLLKVQLSTIKAVLNDCLRTTPEEEAKIRQTREKEAFEKEVDKMMDKLAPVVILAPGGGILTK